MFSFGLFSTHLPFIVIGIVSFGSMAYAYLNPGALVENENHNTFNLEFEGYENNTDSSINFFEAEHQYHANINPGTDKDTPLPQLIAILSPPEKPPLDEHHFSTFFARPPPSF